MNIRDLIKSRDLYMVAVVRRVDKPVYGYGITPSEAMRAAIRALQIEQPGVSHDTLLEEYGDQLSSALRFRVGKGIADNRGWMV